MFYNAIMHPKDADGMAKRVRPDQPGPEVIKLFFHAQII